MRLKIQVVQLLVYITAHVFNVVIPCKVRQDVYYLRKWYGQWSRLF